MTGENPRGSLEKKSPKESVEGADTVLRSSVWAPEGFSLGQIRGCKTERALPRGFAAKGLPKQNFEEALTLTRSTVSLPEALS